MLPPLLLLSLLWAGECAKGRGKPEASADSTFSTGFQAQDRSYSLRVEESVTVQEGLCLYVPCQFFYPMYYGFYVLHGYWFQKGTNRRQDPLVATNNPDRKVQLDTQGRFRLLGDLKDRNCSLDIRDAQRRDSGTYFFRVERGPHVRHSYLQNQISVLVTALTHTPDILIPETLESGRPWNLTCSVPWACKRGTPPIFSWTSAAPTSLGPRNHLSSMLTLTPRPQDHGTNLTCQVLFPAAGVMVAKTIQLNVTCATQNSTAGVCLVDGTGKLETRAGMIKGAIWGAGITTLLVLCLCLIFFGVKTCRKTASRRAVGMDAIHSAVEPAPLGCQQESEQDLPAKQTSSAGVSPALEMEQELYYASISFHKMKNTYEEYSEIMTK
ncbi:myeloid cell surface antigen CD33-like isoform X1 [Crocuta crocuta]